MKRTPAVQAVVNDLRTAAGLVAKPGCCLICKEPFTSANVFTDAGWRETKISETCEKCWDRMFPEEGS